MKIRSLSATFGRLESQTLHLSPGLNVIEAGNESGKSTWMTFLRVMLYGLNTRDRSPHADKHRYLPWTGSPMQGCMEFTYNNEDITIRRSTARANSPMGAFAAEYTGTTTPVPDLAAASLGETLLGVPQDVFERSAFIRQSGISIDQSAALERRITALLTTGEESSSYTDAADRLRKQLNRRRYNQTGLLPQLENEISALENTLTEISSLEQTMRTCEAERDALTGHQTYLHHQLTLIDAADNAQLVARRDAAHIELSAAESTHAAAVSRVAHLPSREELTSLIGDFSALESIGDSVSAAQSRASELSSSLEQSEQQLNAHPFAPQTPDEAANSPITGAPRPRFPILLLVLSAVFSIILFLTLRYLIHVQLPLAALCTTFTAAALAACITISTMRRQKNWDTEATLKQKEKVDFIAAYTTLYNEVDRKRAAYRAAADTHHTLSVDYQLHLDRILSRVQRFHSVDTLSDAHRAVESALSLHAACDHAAQAKEQAQLRFDLLNEHAPQDISLPTETPALSRAEAERRLTDVTARLSDLQRRIHTAEGRIQALGDPLLIRADLEQKRRAHEQYTAEYEAITLAQSVLTSANTAMQNRFSPVLGEKAATIFTKLTKGKYNKVLLDRKMVPSAQENGDILSHEVFSLSQGAADQLYLAVRLAICDMVLPAENCVPIFLDDALVTFDDERMAAALDHLVELAEQRQILLFTCQQRELAYLRKAHPGRFHAVALS